MLVLILWTVITTGAIHGTVSYEECKKLNFEPQACVTSKILSKGEKLK